MQILILNTVNFVKSSETSHLLKMKFIFIGFIHSLVSSKTTCNLPFENDS